MSVKEIAISELWRRLGLTTGVVYTARNPKTVPSLAQLNCLQIFELEDEVVGKAMRGGWPIYTRRIRIVIEAIVKGTTDNASSKELDDFLSQARKQIYNGGNNLGGACAFLEEETASQVVRPPIGEFVSAKGMVFYMTYIDDTSKI